MKGKVSWLEYHEAPAALFLCDSTAKINSLGAEYTTPVRIQTAAKVKIV